MIMRYWKEPKNYIAPEDDSVAEGVEVEEDGLGSNLEEEGKATPQMKVLKM